jgi:hypothetical protein
MSPHHGWAKDLGHAVGGSFLVTLIGLLSIMQEGGFPPIDASQSKMLIWAVQVGGPLFLALILVLWFYRRDFKTAINETREANKVVIELTKATVSAMNENRASSDALSLEIRRFMDRRSPLER